VNPLVEKKVIGIIFWSGYIGVSPSLINAIDILSHSEYRIEIFSRRDESIRNFADSPKFSSDVKMFEMDPLFFRLIKKYPQLIQSGSGLKQYFLRLLRISLRPIDFFRFYLLISRSENIKKYCCFIGVDKEGLVLGSVLGKFYKKSVIFWSLEMEFLKDQSNPFNILLKILEKKFHSHALFTIIQDSERANCLVKENYVINPRIVIVPNAPLGPPPRLKSEYLRQVFFLPEDKIILIHAGMISENVLSEGIALESTRWPENWVLIFHEREKRNISDPYLKKIQNIGGDHVRLSLNPVLYTELDGLLSSAQIGVVAYDTQKGPNFSLISGASGKLAHYLRCGLPTICIGVENIDLLLQEYEFGISIDSVEDMKSGIQKILKNYEYYQQNALKCYEEKMEFGKNFKMVLDEINKIL
jgi:glycosyltransferase involved in cell wall biosynthesis